MRKLSEKPLAKLTPLATGWAVSNQQQQQQQKRNQGINIRANVRSAFSTFYET